MAPIITMTLALTAWAVAAGFLVGPTGVTPVSAACCAGAAPGSVGIAKPSGETSSLS